MFVPLVRIELFSASSMSSGDIHDSDMSEAGEMGLRSSEPVDGSNSSPTESES
jgi:hypothetical protein